MLWIDLEKNTLSPQSTGLSTVDEQMIAGG
ncbi:hypothetical protein VIDI103191_10890 [Vibrio diazotrophicus]|jgi:hypothetical protein